MIMKIYSIPGNGGSIVWGRLGVPIAPGLGVGLGRKGIPVIACSSPLEFGRPSELKQFPIFAGNYLFKTVKNVNWCSESHKHTPSL